MKPRRNFHEFSQKLAPTLRKIVRRIETLTAVEKLFGVKCKAGVMLCGNVFKQ